MSFDLVITDSFQDHFSKNLEQAVAELKKRFGQPLIMIYTSVYDPVIIEKMASTGIDAYVHKYESIGRSQEDLYRIIKRSHLYLEGSSTRYTMNMEKG